MLLFLFASNESGAFICTIINEVQKWMICTENGNRFWGPSAHSYHHYHFKIKERKFCVNSVLRFGILESSESRKVKATKFKLWDWKSKEAITTLMLLDSRWCVPELLHYLILILLSFSKYSNCIYFGWVNRPLKIGHRLSSPIKYKNGCSA